MVAYMFGRMALRIQSAMEYLMTYGWAILIIAVVLGALFGLGFFNSASLAPKVTAGSCQIYRPNGPGTTTFINTEGVCNNELPQYVANFNRSEGYIITGTAGLPGGSAARSVFAWVSFTGNTAVLCDIPGNLYNCYAYGYGTTATNERSQLGIYEGNVIMDADNNGFPSSLRVPPVGWHFIGYTYASGSSTVTLYMDGQSQTGSLPDGALATVLSSSYIGSQLGGTGSFFTGSLANIQVYNTSLSSNEVTALYQEGIGGDPVLLNSLVAWWPLNGNSNDYSGNQNNGVSENSFFFTSSWTSGYSAP